MKLPIRVAGFLGFAAAALAQTGGISALDALTPKGLEPGSPAGSYALSGLDTVNLYNGSLNLSIPLLQVGGRGESGYTMRAQPRTGWDAFGDLVTAGGTCSSQPCPTWSFSKAGTDLGYRPASITIRPVGQGLGNVGPPQGQTQCPGTFFKGTLNRITITMADATEMEFRDAMAGGGVTGPVASQLDCGYLQRGAYNRGKIWVSTNSTGAKFVADNDVYDINSPSSVSVDNTQNASLCTPIKECFTYQPAGTLYFRDGRKYHFAKHQSPAQSFLLSTDVDWIEDRNGNRTLFLYPTQWTTSVANPTGGAACTWDATAIENFCVVDPLGRIIKVSIGIDWTGWTAAPCTSGCFGKSDRILYPGAGGQSRTIEVFRRPYWYDRLPVLQGENWPSALDLFGGKACGTSACPGQPSNPNSCVGCPFDWQISKIALPDASTYQFNYDRYGDPARVVVPIGGSFEFDWENGPGVQTGVCSYTTPCPIVHAAQNNPDDLLIAVYRRVKERREFANGGTSWTRKTVYSVSEQAADSTLEDPIGVCTATPDYQTTAGYPYATQGWCSKVQVDENDALQGALSREFHYFYGAASQGMFPVQGWYTYWAEAKEFRTDIAAPSGTPVLRKQVQNWTQNSGLASALNWWVPSGQIPGGGSMGPKPAIDPRTYQSDVTLDGGKVSRKLFSDDVYSNRSDVWEYKFGQGSPGILLRQNHTDYVNDGNYNSIPASLSGTTATPFYRYLVSLPSLEAVKDATGADKAQTSYLYDQVDPYTYSNIVNNVSPGLKRGNLTTYKRWRDSDGAWMTTTGVYDVAGNVREVHNPRGYVNSYMTSYSFADSTTNGCAGQGLSNTYAFVSVITDPLSQTAKYEWDCYLAKPTKITDVADDATQAQYSDGNNDKLDRLSKILRPTIADDASGAPVAMTAETRFVYSPGLRDITTYQDQKVTSDGRHQVKLLTDALGRTIESRQYTVKDGASLATTTVYDGLGRVRQISNPGTTTEWTVKDYDSLGRVTKITYPDTSSADRFVFAGSVSFRKDAAGKTLWQDTDAAGRLTRVIEAPSLAFPDEGNTAQYNTFAAWTPDCNVELCTDYIYDVLDNLETVTQGAQVRSFRYDSLSRLIAAKNPEIDQTVSGTTSCDATATGNWSVCYKYDENGNLKTQVSPGVTITFTYDNLDRMTFKDYGDTTPDVTYSYNTTSGKRGCLGSVGNSVSTTNKTYGPECVVLTSSQATTGGTQSSYGFLYGHDLSGALVREEYPSGRKVTIQYDDAGRPTSLCGLNCGAGNVYANTFQYAQYGLPTSMTLGNTVVETHAYNNRLQITSIQAGSWSLTNCYQSGQANCSGVTGMVSGNNGNVQGQLVSGVARSYTYDALNRLTMAQTAGWSEGYSYDRFGNRAVTTRTGSLPGLTGETPHASTDYSSTINGSTTNRIIGVGYDGRGNITSVPGRNANYDGDNRQISMTNTQGYTAGYDYNGEGRRVKKTFQGQTTVFVYDAMGELVAEYGGPAPPASGRQYMTADHLGSTRLITNNTGGQVKTYDYLPFGEEIGVACLDADNGVKFTSQYRDKDSCLDYFKARYVSAAQGRFTSPDRPFVDQFPANPQSWNLYSYTRNNPLAFIDAEGQATIKAVPGASGYAYRGDLTNEFDNPNFHIFNRKGNEIGRISVQEAETGRILDSGNKETAMKLITEDASGYTVPNAVREGIESVVQQRGIQPRFAASGGPFKGFTVKGLGVLQILSVLAGAVADYKEAQRTGIATTLFGENKILDPTKAAATLGSGGMIIYTDKSGKSQFYTVNNGQFVRGGCNQKKEDCGIGDTSGGSFRVVDPSSVQ